MRTIPDSNVFLDVFRAEATWSRWSVRWLNMCRGSSVIVVNPVTFAETASHFSTCEEYEDLLRGEGAVLEDIPWNAAFLAGHAHRSYRRAGGIRERTLPDFLIGAHAATKGYRILTRDGGRYRSYFPNVEVIAPDTHP
jgi:predicted nucleic acid-binding protein